MMPSNKLIHNAISAVLWNSLIMIFQKGSGRRQPQQEQIHQRAGLWGSGYGSTGKPKKSTALSNYILSGRPLYKVALQTRRFCLETCGLTSKEWFNNETNWPRPQGQSVLLTSMTSVSTTGISYEASQGKLHSQHFVSPLSITTTSCCVHFACVVR